MIRTKQEQTVEFKCIRGGNGEAEMRKITIGDAELYGKGRMFNHMVTYNDNGTIVTVHPGDTTICNDGELHGLVNDGTEPLEFIALILY